MTKPYPRSRAETGLPPEPRIIAQYCRTYWDLDVAEVRNMHSRCVFFCDRTDGDPVILRVNPGWDGPTDPTTIVEFIDHLAKASAPCPHIIPTTDGSLSKNVGYFTLLLETLLVGEMADRVDNLDDVGAALARLHDAAETFAALQGAQRDITAHIAPALTYCEETDLPPAQASAIRAICAQIRAQLEPTPVRWVLSHGDVRDWNTIVSPQGEVRFTDFSGARFAPALRDLVMTRTQWLMGNAKRLLSDDELRAMVRGYTAVRPFTPQERSCIPLLWATYYAQRLCDFHRKWEPESVNRGRWNLAQRILDLPDTAIEMVDALLEGSA